jgi:serine/threonine-protein kinase
MAVRFDAERLELTGTPVPVVEGVLQSPAIGIAQYTVSATGSLVYLPALPQATQRRLVWVSRNGVEQSIAAPEHVYWNPRVSPDGRRLALQIMDPEPQIWLYDFARETLTPLTFGGGRNGNGSPVWTPDGKRITFGSNREGQAQQEIYWQSIDGGSGFERLASGEYSRIPSSWSPDGQLLAFTEPNPNTGGDVGVLRLGDRVAQPFIRTPAREYAPQFSPDGRWLAYVSNESGRPEVCVRPYPGPGEKWQVSTSGGAEPVWNPNGRELFYRSGDKMMSVEIATRPSFVAGKPRMLFEGPYVATSPVFTSPLYDVAPDGQRFLMLKATEQTQAAPTQINVVLNWTEELKRLVPTK